MDRHHQGDLQSGLGGEGSVAFSEQEEFAACTRMPPEGVIGRRVMSRSHSGPLSVAVRYGDAWMCAGGCGHRNPANAETCQRLDGYKLCGRERTAPGNVRIEVSAAARELATIIFDTDDTCLEILAQIECTSTLSRVSCVSKSFQALLRREPGSRASWLWERAWLDLNDSSHAMAILCRVPAGERVRLGAGVTLSGIVLIAQPIHLKAEAGARLSGQLRLENRAAGGGTTSSSLLAASSWCEKASYEWGGGRGKAAAAAASPGGAAGGWQGEVRGGRQTDGGSGMMDAGSAVGVIEGLAFSHFMEAAISVRSGHWQLVGCEVRSGASR